MDRVSSTGFQTIGGKRFWQNKNLTAGIQGTTFDQVFFDGVQESIIGVAEATGIVPADATPGSADLQLLQAIRRIAGGNVETVSAATVALTADNAGLVLVNAGSNNVAITLPAVASAGGQTLHFMFVRLDASANSVTFAESGSDTVFPTGSVAGLAPSEVLELRGDGVSVWVNPWALQGYLTAAQAALAALPSGITGSAPGSTKTASFSTPFGTLSFDGTTTGAGGMDTGSIGASADLSFYATLNAATGAAAVFGCLGSVSRGPAYTGSHMPAGYVGSRLICAVVADGSADVPAFGQVGRRILLKPPQQVLSSTSSPTTFQSIALASYVPAAAVSVSGNQGTSVAASGGVAMAVASDAAATGQQLNLDGPVTGPYPSYDGWVGNAVAFRDLPLLTAQTIYWLTGGGSGTYRVTVSDYQI